MLPIWYLMSRCRALWRFNANRIPMVPVACSSRWQIIEVRQMDRRELVLALLASSEGRQYTPAQLQKAAFLVTRNMPQIVQGTGFHFVPYDYGPFDSDVYNE